MDRLPPAAGIIGKTKNCLVCHDFSERIDSYIDGELGKEDSLSFEAHLDTCMTCQKELQSMDKCVRLMRKFFDDESPPDSIKKNVFDKCGCGDCNDYRDSSI